MRALIWITAVVAALWSGYWFVGKAAVEKTTEAMVAQLANDGISVETSSRGVQGFPNRFDLTLNDLHVLDSVTGFEWTAPFFQMFSLSYKPWHIIAAFPPTQEVDGVTVKNTKMQASLLLRPTTALPLDRTTLIGEDVSVSLPTGQGFLAKTLRFATRQTEETGRDHQIGLDLLDISLPDAVPPFSNRVEKLHFDVTAQFSSPLDRFAGETRPELTGLKITEAIFVWDDLKLFLSGEVSAKNGLAQGKLVLRAENWRDLIPLVQATGTVDPAVLANIEKTMASFAQKSNGVDVLSVPITVVDGQMKLGFMPLGPFPLMDQRQ